MRFVPSLLAFGVGAALSVLTAALAYLTQIVHTEHPYANSELVAGDLPCCHRMRIIGAGCLLCRDDPRRVLAKLNLVRALAQPLGRQLTVHAEDKGEFLHLLRRDLADASGQQPEVCLVDLVGHQPLRRAEVDGVASCDPLH